MSVRSYILLVLIICLPQAAFALPWDQDMFSQQSYKSNEMSRAPAEGTVPIGRPVLRMTTEEADTKLQNPVAVDLNSGWRGKRLWTANCATCHGPKADGQGPVGPKMGVPDLRIDLYKNRTDGRSFAVIYHGGVNMPRYGFKFSAAEEWDIINYLRFLQGKDIEGLERPK